MATRGIKVRRLSEGLAISLAGSFPAEAQSPGTAASVPVWLWVLLAALAALCVALGLTLWRQHAGRPSQDKADQPDATRRPPDRGHGDGADTRTMLAMAVHDIRTPLTSLLGMADLLARTPLSADQQRYLETLRTAGGVLARQADDLLDLTRPSTDTQTINHGPVSLQALLDQQAALWTPQAAKKGLQIDVSVDPALPAHIMSDADRIQQILHNLISNAIKNTEAGRIRLAVGFDRPNTDGTAARFLRFDVTDTGSGIKAETLNRIFDAFDTGADVPGDGSSGLGLAICRRLVHRLGGTLQVTSEPGTGSRFWFTLPYRATEAENGPVPAASSLMGLDEAWPNPDMGDPSGAAMPAGRRDTTILVVEDDHLTQAVLATFLAQDGWSCRLVGTGAEALAQLAQGGIDLVLLDERLPGRTGTEIAAQIISAQAPSPPPIIGLTAAADDTTAQRLTEAGADRVLTKPVSAPHLAAAIEATLAARDRPDPV